MKKSGNTFTNKNWLLYILIGLLIVAIGWGFFFGERDIEKELKDKVKIS